MSRCKYGRHIPAFILLFLADGPCYGSTLVNRLAEELPYNRADSAAVYRALKELEQEGAVTSYWDTSEPGPARRWYRITPLGYEKLAYYKQDIEERLQNLQYFLRRYAELEEKRRGEEK